MLSPNVLQSAGPVVGPVIDYEPPPFGGPPTLPPVAVARPRLTALTAPAGGDDAGGCGANDVAAAAIFADAALRRVLEVIDRRRSLAQLRPLMPGGLVDSLLPAVDRRQGTDPARLRRVRAQSVRTDGTAAEIAASYSRAERVHAIACRVEQFPTATGPRWQVVALHLG